MADKPGLTENDIDDLNLSFGELNIEGAYECTVIYLVTWLPAL